MTVGNSCVLTLEQSRTHPWCAAQQVHASGVVYTTVSTIEPVTETAQKQAEQDGPNQKNSWRNQADGYWGEEL